MLKISKVGFVGSGIMAEAMIKGLLRNKLLSAEQITASGPRETRGQQLQGLYGIQSSTHNISALDMSDVVVFSVKPQIMPAVLKECAQRIPPGAMVLSIAAGVPIQIITQTLDHDAVVRAMPNTPAQIGEGITVWAKTSTITEQQSDVARTILGAFGEELFVEHEYFLDMATALSGTGPAYVLLFMEAMIDAGVHMGFSRRIAEKLVLQTMKGTVEYARQSPRHPATLRNEVTSPGGTSAEALYHLEKGGMRTVLSRAIWAAYQRSITLGKNNLVTQLSSDEET